MPFQTFFEWLQLVVFWYETDCGHVDLVHHVYQDDEWKVTLCPECRPIEDPGTVVVIQDYDNMMAFADAMGWFQSSIASAVNAVFTNDLINRILLEECTPNEDHR